MDNQARSSRAQRAAGTKGLWEQVAHVDPTAANSTEGKFTQRSTRRTQLNWADGPRFYD